MKYTGRILLSTILLVGFLKYGFPKIKDWAGKSIERLEQKECNMLERYVKGTTNVEMNPGGNYWKYVLEDIKNNPKLQEMIKNKEIDMHSLATFYKKINNGKYPVGAGIYQRPIWNLNDSN